MRETRRIERWGVGLTSVALVSIGLVAGACTGPNAAAQIGKARTAYQQAQREFASCHAPYEAKSAELYLAKAVEEFDEHHGEAAHRFATISEKRSRDAITRNNKTISEGKATHCAPYHEHGG